MGSDRQVPIKDDLGLVFQNYNLGVHERYGQATRFRVQGLGPGFGRCKRGLTL